MQQMSFQEMSCPCDWNKEQRVLSNPNMDQMRGMYSGDNMCDEAEDDDDYDDVLLFLVLLN